MTDTIELKLPVGRIVWGNPIKQVVKKNYTTKQPVIKNGQPVMQSVCGVAIPKAEFEQQVLPYFQQIARTLYPNGLPPQFSWKYTDGDGIDKNGQPYSSREGYAGHYVIKLATEAFMPSIWKKAGGAFVDVKEGEIKTGDYVIASITVKGHTNNSGGLYLNPNGYTLVGTADEIVNTFRDPNQMFGDLDYQLPAGATAVGAAPVGGQQPMQGMPPQQPMQGMPPQQPMQGMPPQQPMQGMPPQQPMQGMPPPATDYPMGNQPVQNAQQQQSGTVGQPQNTTAVPATGYHGNQS